MIGFGDPVFDPRAAPDGDRKRSQSRGKARAYSDYWRGAGIDRNMLMQGLPQLPDTADELKAIRAQALVRESRAATYMAPAAMSSYGQRERRVSNKESPAGGGALVYKTAPRRHCSSDRVGRAQRRQGLPGPRPISVTLFFRQL
jgi:hypothetical protein